MDAFVYQAALLCAGCGQAVRARIVTESGISEQLLETGTDSDGFPQGPYANGGGEADSPQHCDSCGGFLDNPLTPDGRRYVLGAIRGALGRVNGRTVAELARDAEALGKQALATWINAYGPELF